jgi:enediyne biosynthesis protein E4
MDILVGNNGGPLLLYHNETPIKGSWIGVDLKGPSHFRDALGSSAQIKTESGTLMTREKNPANGYRGQNDPRLHFGIDTQQTTITVDVLWWDGKKETFHNLTTNKYHQLKYGEAQ